MLTGWRHDLHQPHPIGFVGVPVLTGQHVAHRVAPAGLADEAHSSPASGKRCRGHFALVEDRVLRRDAQIRGEEQFVRHARHMPLHSDDEWLGALRTRGRNRIDEILRCLERSVAKSSSPRCLVEAL